MWFMQDVNKNIHELFNPLTDDTFLPRIQSFPLASKDYLKSVWTGRRIRAYKPATKGLLKTDVYMDNTLVPPGVGLGKPV